MMRFFLLMTSLIYGTTLCAQDTTRVSLLFLGDIMQHDSQINAAYDVKTSSYNYAECFQFVKPYIQQADVAIGNLELTLAGPPYKGYPQFSAPDNLAVVLKDVGVDVLVTANNHSLDRRRKGVERTLDVLDSLKIKHTGTFRDTVERLNESPLMLYKNGFSIALLNYTYGTNGIPVTPPNVVNLIDTAIIHRDLIKAKSLLPDAIIVFTHWGLEYQRQPSVEQKRITEFCFANGANLVIGSHPHVLQPMEWRDSTHLVVYSLGNFVSGQRDRYKNGGAMVEVELTKVGDEASTTTMISKAHYILEYVYRTVDAKRDYYILPIPSFEQDTLNVIQDKDSKLALKTFAQDSRKLFATYNKNVSESTRVPPDSVETYRISFTQPEGDSVAQRSLPPITKFFYGLETMTDANGITRYLTGNFSSKEAASFQLSKFSEYADARVVRFVNGVLQEE